MMIKSDKTQLEVPIVQKSEPKHRFKRFFAKIKSSSVNTKNNLVRTIKKPFKKIDKEMIKEFFLYGLVYGVIINYVLWEIFDIRFRWYGFPAYGIFLYLIKSEALQIWTELWFKGEK